jgi:hypothetical protein
MPRLSCVFFFPSCRPAALKLAGYYNRELLDEYAAVEQRIGYTLRHKESLVTIQQSLDAGWQPAGGAPMEMWDDGHCA